MCIKENTNSNRTVTFFYKKENIPYSVFSDNHDIYYSHKNNRYVVINDSDEKTTVSWEEYLKMLGELKIERLMEMHINTSDSYLVNWNVPHNLPLSYEDSAYEQMTEMIIKERLLEKEDETTSEEEKTE